METESIRIPGPLLVKIATMACTAAVAAGCTTTGAGARLVPVVPMCTVLAEAGSTGTISWNGQVLVAERVDPTASSGFAAFRTMAGPRGNPLIGFTNPTGVPDTYGISEAWLRSPGGAEVHRAQATPAPRTTSAGDDTFASAWNITAQDASGAWSRVFGTGSANRGAEPDPPEVGEVTVPRFMPVGVAVPQMFACAGGRTLDNGDRTTWLIESIAPKPARSVAGSVTPIQDLLNGDDRGPSSRPSPTVSGPGNPIRTGAVECGMTQTDDDVTTRQLNMIAISNGVLYHSLASNFGPVTSGSGATFSRFRTVSAWGDVGQALGGGFGNVVSAAVVGQPAAISLFFVADAGNGRYRLFHTVRFASGSWRPVKDVLALSGDAPNGTVYAFHVAAGTCPEPGAATWDASSTEHLVALWGGPGANEVLVLRVVPAARQWRAGVNGDYSPWSPVPSGALGGTIFLRDVVVSARPFRDDAKPPP